VSTAPAAVEAPSFMPVAAVGLLLVVSPAAVPSSTGGAGIGNSISNTNDKAEVRAKASVAVAAPISSGGDSSSSSDGDSGGAGGGQSGESLSSDKEKDPGTVAAEEFAELAARCLGSALPEIALEVRFPVRVRCIRRVYVSAGSSFA